MLTKLKILLIKHKIEFDESIYFKYSTTSWLLYSGIQFPGISYRVIKIKSFQDYSLLNPQKKN